MWSLPHPSCTAHHIPQTGSIPPSCKVHCTLLVGSTLPFTWDPPHPICGVSPTTGELTLVFLPSRISFAFHRLCLTVTLPKNSSLSAYWEPRGPVFVVAFIPGHHLSSGDLRPVFTSLVCCLWHTMGCTPKWARAPPHPHSQRIEAIIWALNLKYLPKFLLSQWLN